MIDNFKQISSKQLKSIPVVLSVVIDGVKLYPHSTLERPLLSCDEDEFEKEKITKDDIITEDLYHILYYLQSTALNLSGQQRVYLRTCDKQIISIDPRLKMPQIFDQYLDMMWRLIQERRVLSLEKETELVKFVKSDLAKSLPAGAVRTAIYTGDEDVKAPSSFLKKERPNVIFIHLNPKTKPNDEFMEGTFCISNENLSAATAISRIVREMENKVGIW